MSRKTSKPSPDYIPGFGLDLIEANWASSHGRRREQITFQASAWTSLKQKGARSYADCSGDYIPGFGLDLIEARRLLRKFKP